MRTRLVVCLAIALVSFVASAKVRAVRHPEPIPTPASVMWIAAHPDDEAVVAPLLALWCRELGARCAMLVFTRGEAGPCVRPDGCGPDIASVRAAEAGAASQYFLADSILLTLPDGGGANPPDWSSAANPELTTAISSYMLAFRPDLVLTFDPRHGTTCHPDHREVGRIALEAANRLPYVPQVYLLETRVGFSTDPLALHFTSAAPGAERFDATLILASTRQSAWSAILDDMRRHASQFDAPWLEAIQSVPESQRAVFLLPADRALAQAVAGCP